MGMGSGKGRYRGTRGSIKYPGNDPTKPPGEGYEWRGKKPVGSDKGAWYNPKNDTSWHPYLYHGFPIGPHWDYIDEHGVGWRVFEDGRVEPK